MKFIFLLLSLSTTTGSIEIKYGSFVLLALC